MSRTEVPLVVLDPVTGDYVAGASVTFFDRASAPITVYVAETGGSVKTQPVLTDVVGRVSAWVDRSAYKVSISVVGHPTRIEFIDSSPAGDGAIDTAWLANSSVTSAKIADATIVAGDIAADAVTTAKILDDNVTNAKIAPAAVTATELAANAITTPKILDGAVTEDKLDPNLVLGNRTMLRANVPKFYLWGSYNPFYFFYAPTQRYRYRSSVFMLGGETDSPISLTNVSPRVSVTLFTGGRTDAYSFWGDDDPRLSYRLIVDGAEYVMANYTTESDDYYRWWWYGYGDDYDSIVTSYLFPALTPGVHTFNIKVNFISDQFFSVFESASVSHILIEEEPSSSTYTPPVAFDQPFTRPDHYSPFLGRF